MCQWEVTPIDSVQTRRDRGQELDQAVKAENLEGNAVKGTSQIIKSQGSSTVKGQPDTKSHQSTIPYLIGQVQSLSGGQAVRAQNSRSICLTPVTGVYRVYLSDPPLDAEYAQSNLHDWTYCKQHIIMMLTKTALNRCSLLYNYDKCRFRRTGDVLCMRPNVLLTLFKGRVPLPVKNMRFVKSFI